MDFLHNRILIDYGQAIVYNPLYRTDGAPFVGMGEKYFSLIDDVEMEIIKCLWETPETYRRFAPPRRIWGLDIPHLGEKQVDPDFPNESYYIPRETYKFTFLKFANNTLEALNKLEQIKDTADILVFNRIERASFFVLAMQIKKWKKVYFYRGFRKAFNVLREYLLRFPEYNYYRDIMEFKDTKDNTVDIGDIIEPCICIFNEAENTTTNIISDKHKGSEIIITYNGRVDYD